MSDTTAVIGGVLPDADVFSSWEQQRVEPSAEHKSGAPLEFIYLFLKRS